MDNTVHQHQYLDYGQNIVKCPCGAFPPAPEQTPEPTQPEVAAESQAPAEEPVQPAENAQVEGSQWVEEGTTEQQPDATASTPVLAEIITELQKVCDALVKFKDEHGL